MCLEVEEVARCGGQWHKRSTLLEGGAGGAVNNVGGAVTDAGVNCGIGGVVNGGSCNSDGVLFQSPVNGDGGFTTYAVYNHSRLPSFDVVEDTRMFGVGGDGGMKKMKANEFDVRERERIVCV
ncbi:hypothetical protein Tco_0828476 [Tanacetum coccineum]